MFADEHLKIPPSDSKNKTLKNEHPLFRALSLSAQAELRYKAKPNPRHHSDQRRLDLSQRRTTPITSGPLICGPLNYGFRQNCQTAMRRIAAKLKARPLRANRVEWVKRDSAIFSPNPAQIVRV